MSWKGGLSLIGREEQGDSVSKILGGSGWASCSVLDRVNLGTRQDDDVLFCSDILQNGSGVCACTVKRRGLVGSGAYIRLAQ